jgi:hypothetical protein
VFDDVLMLVILLMLVLVIVLVIEKTAAMGHHLSQRDLDSEVRREVHLPRTYSLS